MCLEGCVAPNGRRSPNAHRNRNRFFIPATPADPCICKSGKLFKDCCYKTLPEKLPEK
jgi:uncharacterized protein YchJ